MNDKSVKKIDKFEYLEVKIRTKKHCEQYAKHAKYRLFERMFYSKH